VTLPRHLSHSIWNTFPTLDSEAVEAGRQIDPRHVLEQNADPALVVSPFDATHQELGMAHLV
jgi:hypothetical protein